MNFQKSLFKEDKESKKMLFTAREEILVEINFREFFFRISGELVLANCALPRISRVFILANWT